MATGNARGIVLLAHGSRDERWREPIEAVAARVTALDPQARVVCAYMELAAPDLRTAAAALIASGAKALRVVPLFLGMGKHAREDLPLQVDALRQAWPHVDFQLAGIVGEEPELVDLLARIASKS
ncbi:sirohydrochlorin cobaltochelatase [Variovorax paradoxus]|uniref:Sirohydrochlorin cobaltochelatase n=1 Tax=Variovorax paradoxus TaxID=34073 RepID=A0AAE3Y2W9_VARPD|nr:MULTISPECIES: CbiX/SirB N-terminal domain-containing protein [Variovorax]MBD9665223.1 CbiX/SirB N-terminal domain-containing protein [Variovorax sp. VRV01]MDP9967101.1 sirohydrochlorin cobaltochelatase [Variovorax paradoxus]MDR6429490.1 sirohydrochlorin cobaltochelatase [Variovorax paradoxus]